MKTLLKWAFIGLVWLTYGCSKDKNGVPQMSTVPGVSAPTSRSFVILAAGQSNMWGQGMMADLYPKQNNIRVINGDEKGPAYAFAMRAAADPTVMVTVIQCAARGSPVRDWQPGALDYSACLSYWRSAGAPAVDVMVWLQGETEGMSGDMSLASGWGAAFSNVARGFRQDLGDAQLPIIYGVIGPNPGNPNGPSLDYVSWGEVQMQQMTLHMDRAGMVRTEDLTLADAWVHFDKDSYTAIGARMFTAYQGVK